MKQAQTGSVSLLRMRPLIQDRSNQLLGIRADLSRPMNDSGGRPLEVLLMRFRPVFGQGGIASPTVASAMSGNPMPFEKDLSRGPRETNIHLFMDELIGNAVVVVIDLDVIIDIDPGFLPVGKDIGLSRERFESWFIGAFKQNLSGGIELLEGAVIEPIQLL